MIRAFREYLKYIPNQTKESGIYRFYNSVLRAFPPVFSKMTDTQFPDRIVESLKPEQAVFAQEVQAVKSSAYGDSTSTFDGEDSDFASSLTSVRSSLYNHVQEHGRTYHAYKDGKYVLPNDEKEQDRLDRQHQILKQHLDGQLALAPIESIQLNNVLDVATGTGLWAVEFADKYPDTNVIGTDLSPIQPDMVPPNLTFEVDDAEDEWLFRQSFDYIHLRAVVTCFANPAAVIRSAYAATTPGGYIEFQDGVFPLQYGRTPPRDSAFVRLFSLLLESAERAGRPWTIAPRYSGWLREAGFVDVTEETRRIAIGPWMEDAKSKKLGAWNMDNWVDGIRAAAPRMLDRLGWTGEDTEALLCLAVDELVQTRIRPMMDMIVVWGRKPVAEDVPEEARVQDGTEPKAV
ncbi:S-adenosyl-L-methionine-dependent methyltransferase [Microthyrium microscopicum]|uniref:S-adenosyl-L-methionine-dependent methyltransferase n=1 Tax=Microthyrium microscopicum TaxID=703497 RepID=A0A6A6USQ4_9PEZI|nr:S-adenosyl-L-methionine-dependent methyltransferase [Microthyrium microscopicum]